LPDGRSLGPWGCGQGGNIVFTFMLTSSFLATAYAAVFG
jgi:hypothetical protein